jgi:hypothetical protein
MSRRERSRWSVTSAPNNMPSFPIGNIEHPKLARKSAWGKRRASEWRLRLDLLEPRFWVVTGTLPMVREDSTLRILLTRQIVEL